MSLCLMQKNHKLLWNIYNTRREKKKNQPFSQLTKTLSYIKLKKKKKIKRKVSYTKNAFQKYFFFKKADVWTNVPENFADFILL